MEIKGSESSPQDPPRCSLGSSSGFRYGSLVNSVSSLGPDATETAAVAPRRAYIAIAVLCYINLLNYMERYTIAGWMICCWTLVVNRFCNPACCKCDSYFSMQVFFLTFRTSFI